MTALPGNTTVRPASYRSHARIEVVRRDAGRQARAVAALGLLCLAALLIGTLRPASAATPRLPEAIAEPDDVDSVEGLFLVASRDLTDHFFRHSVILLVNDDAEGTQGLVVNRKLDLNLDQALPELDHAQNAGEHPVFFGGPVSLDQFFLLTRNPVPETHASSIAGKLFFSSDRHVLDSLLALRTPEDRLHLYLGYTGWAPGQLAIEIMHGAWHLTSEDPETIFEQPVQTLWNRLIDKLDPPGTEVVYRPGTERRRHFDNHAL